MFSDIDLKYRTTIDVARRFQDTPRTVKVNVYNNNLDTNELFSFAYSLEKNKLLEIYRHGEVIGKEIIRDEFSDDDLNDITHSILRRQGLHVDCLKMLDAE